MEPPGPQQWGTRPLSRKPRFTQHWNHNIAGDPQKAFKCLFFKVVSRAGEQLSEVHNEELNLLNQQRGERKQKREDSRRRSSEVLKKKTKSGNKEKPNLSHIRNCSSRCFRSPSAWCFLRHIYSLSKKSSATLGTPKSLLILNSNSVFTFFRHNYTFSGSLLSLGAMLTMAYFTEQGIIDWLL
jgi:hypothetical protein